MNTAVAWPSFSLMFFASQPAEAERGKFDVFRATTRFADARGFEAVWIPERHFHAFGGIFPNPALAAVVLAETTRRIRIRAGSVVMPLHHPIRVAEEWAVVDNLSNGRVDISAAIGWNPNDFVIAPERYAARKEVTYASVETLRRLWRGEACEFENGQGQRVKVKIHPLPLQPDLNLWFTCSGGAERYVDAGERGYHVLTALLFQRLDDLATKITAYREAWTRAGHAGRGRVTLMLHTYVGADEAAVKSMVREPFKRYLESSTDLWQVGESRLQDLTGRRRADVLEYAFERYYQKTGLMGSVDTCARMVRDVAAAGVDEIACLIDFGLPAASILEGLEHLDGLRRAPVA
jgi:natural product biosynthesis luciferase-like monooxygenase protein